MTEFDLQRFKKIASSVTDDELRRACMAFHVELFGSVGRGYPNKFKEAIRAALTAVLWDRTESNSK